MDAAQHHDVVAELELAEAQVGVEVLGQQHVDQLVTGQVDDEVAA